MPRASEAIFIKYLPYCKYLLNVLSVDIAVPMYHSANLIHHISNLPAVILIGIFHFCDTLIQMPGYFIFEIANQDTPIGIIPDRPR